MNAEKPRSSKQRVIKNMLTLALGAGLAKVIGLLVMPILSRLYGAEEFGVLSVFSAAIGLLAPWMTFRYVVAIPLPKRDGTAINLLAGCFLLSSVLSILLCGLFLSFKEIFSLLSLGKVSSYWGILVFGAFFAALYEMASMWAVRQSSFKELSKAQFLQAWVGVLTKLVAGLFGVKALGLLAGQVFQQSGGWIILARQFYPSAPRLFKKISLKRIWLVFRRYRDFPKYRMPSQVLLAFASQTPVIFFSILYGIAETGYLGLAMTTLAAPITLFGTTTSQAYYGEIAKIGRSGVGEIRNLTVEITKKLLLASILPFLVLFLGGEKIFALAFGQEWTKAGLFASLMSVYLLPQFVASPLANVLNIFERQRLAFALNLARLIIVVVVFLIASHLSLNELEYVRVYSLSLFFYYLVFCAAIYWVLNSEAGANREERVNA